MIIFAQNYYNKKMSYTFVIPVYNRPEEIDELLDSLSKQTYTNFSVIVVEDGSTIKCENIIDKYSQSLKITYIYQDNTGPGMARNHGSKLADSDYIIYLDSDCVAPEGYLERVNEYLEVNKTDSFGGADRSLESFSDIQKAISYSMTSRLTTGGIRGAKKSMDKFFPRSFNMGITKEVFNITGGFSSLRFGEDIDLSYRIIKSGFQTTLIEGAFVYHKRRTSEKAFFKQVFFSGMARVNLSMRHKNTLKLVHALPALFVVFSLMCILSLFIFPLVIIAIIWFLDSLRVYRSLNVAILSAEVSFIQLWGYGLGFIYGFWNRIIKRKPEDSTYNTNFF